MKKTIIFDMDGVIIDSEHHWKKAELNLFGKLVPKWSKEDQKIITGLSVQDVYKVLQKDYGLNLDYEQYMTQVEAIALEVYRTHCQLMDGFLPFIKKLKKDKWKIGLASSSMREWIDITLDRFKIRSFFDITISADEINAPSKPDPTIYLEAAKQLNVKPEDCIAIEDSTNGATAAKNAGMVCIGFRNGWNDTMDLSMTDVETNGFQLDSKWITAK